MLHVDQNEKLPLHTFLPSPAEMLPLPLPMPVVTVMAVAVAMMATAVMLRRVAMTTVAMVIIADVPLLFLLAPVVIFIHCVVGGVCR